MFSKLGDASAAATHYRTAIQLRPDYADAIQNLGKVLMDLGDLAGAVSSFQRAAEIRPDTAGVYLGLGRALIGLRRLDEAIAVYRAGLQVVPDAHICNDLGHALLSQGKAEEAVESFRRAVDIDPQDAVAQSNLLLALHYPANASAKEIWQEHQAFGRRCQAAAGPARSHFDNTPDPGRRIRVGYLSPDFCRGPVMDFLEPLLEAHDHQQFEITSYYDRAERDQTTSRAQSLTDRWRDIWQLTDEQVTRLVEDDQIDILVDLAGHVGRNRLAVFARRAAPLQVSYLGYSDTTGLPAMDYRITDAWVDPPGQSEPFQVEQLIRLTHGWACYRPPADAPEVGGLPAVQRGYVTFGSFNNVARLTGEVAAAWSAILARVPGSRLLIRSGAPTAMFHGACLNLLSKAGISPARVEIDGGRPIPEHLGRYNEVDIALDTFPCSGGTTTCEALWMGVSVITLAGWNSYGRLALSALCRAGLPNLVAHSPSEYIDVAVGLASDLHLLGDLRSGLRERMLSSPLCQGSTLAREMEAAYRRMWQDWCASKR